jgi:hypothetical protein
MLFYLLFFCAFIQNTHAMEPAAFTSYEQAFAEYEQIEALFDEVAILYKQVNKELDSTIAKPRTRATVKKILAVKNKILKVKEKHSLAQAAFKIAKERKLVLKGKIAICNSCKAKEIAVHTIIPKE